MINTTDIDNSWEIIEYFTNPQNDDLHHALINGTNALSINFTEPISEKEISALFDGIHMDFIDLYLEGDASTVRIAEKLTKKPPNFEIYQFMNASYQEELTDFLAVSKAYLSNGDLNICPRISFHVNDKYLENIPRIRAIRILWSHMLKSFSLSGPEVKIIAVAGAYREDSEVEEDYIHASIQLMSSLIASADGVLINVPEKSKKSRNFKSRIARNLHHLAMQEGRMGLVDDPLKGSYFIEESSNAYAKAAWNKFIG